MPHSKLTCWDHIVTPDEVDPVVKTTRRDFQASVFRGCSGSCVVFVRRALIDFRKERATNPLARRPPSPVFGVLFLTAQRGLISSPDLSLSELSVLEPVVG